LFTMFKRIFFTLHFFFFTTELVAVEIEKEFKLKVVTQEELKSINVEELNEPTTYTFLTSYKHHQDAYEMVSRIGIRLQSDSTEIYTRLLYRKDWGIKEWRNDLQIENLYLKFNPLKNLFFTFGRQELNFADGFVVGNSRNDLAKTMYTKTEMKSFDAIKISFERNKLLLDIVALAKRRETYTHINANEDNLLGINLQSKQEKGKLEFGLFLQDTHVQWVDFTTGSTSGDLYPYVLALVFHREKEFKKDVKFKTTLVREWGHHFPDSTVRDDILLDAWAGEIDFSFSLHPHLEMNIGYQYYSGDDSGSTNFEEFNPLYEDKVYAEIVDLINGSDGVRTNTDSRAYFFGIILKPLPNIRGAIKFCDFTRNSDNKKLGWEIDCHFFWLILPEVNFEIIWSYFSPGEIFLSSRKAQQTKFVLTSKF